MSFKSNDYVEDKSPDFVLPLIVLIIIILSVGGLLILLFTSNFATINPETTGINTSNLKINCPVGQCATDIQTGVKTCPLSDQIISIDPSTSVCNSPYFCDNPLTPYALQSDGSTNFDGVCETNSQCPCLKFPQCPRYVLSAFTAANGDPYQSFAGQRIYFPQIASYVNNQGISSNQPPIQYKNQATTFCLVPSSWLPLSSPGCNFVPFDKSNNINLSDVVTCMGMINNCNGSISSPCLQGTLAFVTDNPELFSISNGLTGMQTAANTVQLGCVTGEPCPCGQIAVFDTRLGSIICQPGPSPSPS